MKFGRPVLFLVFSPRLQKGGGGGNITLVDIKVVPAGVKPPAADDSMRTSTGRRCGFGASVPLLTRASPILFLGAIKRSSAIMPKLVKLVGPTSTLAKGTSPFFAQSAAASSVFLRCFMSDSTSASMTRRVC